MASGEVPPSQGVIIDADGDVVSQAVGFNGDHYLPFDLRNLGSLQGGQYVRTRATGGPTTEDIYTGLMTGARQIQVVSNSGVFTVEFDPDLRGGRRYTDKARRMVSRYEEMLEHDRRRQDHDIYERDLPRSRGGTGSARRWPRPPTARRSSARASTMRGPRLGWRLAGRQRGRRDRDRGGGREPGKTYMIRQVPHLREIPSPRQYASEHADFKAKCMRENAGQGASQAALDGAGYDRAMHALKQEFPYFIRRRHWKPLPDWHRLRGMRNRHAMTRSGPTTEGHVSPARPTRRSG